MPNHVEIRRSKSTKNPFKVTWIGANGEPLQISELLSTVKNAKKNIAAIIRISHGSHALVREYDKKGNLVRSCTLNGDGLDLELKGDI